MMQVGTNQPASYHSQPSLSTSGGGQQPGRSSSGSRQSQSQSQYHNEQQTGTTAGSTSDIRPRCCILRRWPHYDGYGVHLARNQHWHGLRIGDVEPNSPAESGGLLREDVVLAVNGHSVENDDFFVILAFIQQELEEDQIRFLVLDPHSADLARRQQLHIDENIPTCVRMETPMLTVSPEKVLYDQWRTTNTIDPISAQNTIQLGPTLSNQSSTLSTQQHQDGRDDVYTFMPYSDRAAENGKLFFDILFEQPKFTHDDSLSKPRDEYSTPPAIRKPIEKIQPTSTIESGEYDKKKRGSGVGEGVKHLVQSSLENLKSYLPSKQQHPSIDDEKENTIDQKRKNSTDSTQGTTRPESPTLLEKLKNKLGRSSGSAASTGEDQHQPYERLWQASSQQPEDSNNNLRSEPRLCSLTLRPGVDHLGISLQPDRDFSHIIKQIEPNSAADRAGMEPDDCIMSINETPVLNIPYEDVLALLKKTRNMPNVDFLVAKKSYLLKPGQNNVTGGDLQRELPGKYSDTTTPGQRGEVLPSSNLTASGSTAAPAVQTLEQLYRKYTSKQQMPSTFDERASPTRPFRETVSTTTNPSDERVLSRSDSDYAGRYPSKQSQPPPPQQQQQGQIIQGVGPATADRSPWGASGGKSSDESPAPVSGSSSVRSWTRGDQRSGADEAKSRGSGLEDAFKPLQVGITNPNSVSSNAPDISLKDDEQYSPRSAPGFEPSSYSTGDLRKDLPSSDPSAASTRRDDSTLSGLRQPPSIQEIGKVSPLAPAAGKHDYETGPPHILPSSRADVDLGPSRKIGGPTAPPKVIQAVRIPDDTDDDDLSDISEDSHEEDVSEPSVNNASKRSTTQPITDVKTAMKTEDKDDFNLTTGKTTQGSTAQPAADDKKPKTPEDEGIFNRLKSSIANVFTASSAAESTSRKSSIDTENPIIDSVSEPDKRSKPVTTAQRVQYSDSEDTQSGAESIPSNTVGADTFYSPRESIDGDEHQQQQPSTYLQRVRKEIGQAVGRADKPQQQQLGTTTTAATSARGTGTNEPSLTAPRADVRHEYSDDDDEMTESGSSSFDSQNPQLSPETIALSQRTPADKDQYQQSEATAASARTTGVKEPSLTATRADLRSKNWDDTSDDTSPMKSSSTGSQQPQLSSRIMAFDERTPTDKNQQQQSAALVTSARNTGGYDPSLIVTRAGVEGRNWDNAGDDTSLIQSSSSDGQQPYNRAGIQAFGDRTSADRNQQQQSAAPAGSARNTGDQKAPVTVTRADIRKQKLNAASEDTSPKKSSSADSQQSYQPTGTLTSGERTTTDKNQQQQSAARAASARNTGSMEPSTVAIGNDLRSRNWDDTGDDTSPLKSSSAGTQKSNVPSDTAAFGGQQTPSDKNQQQPTATAVSARGAGDKGAPLTAVAPDVRSEDLSDEDEFTGSESGSSDLQQPHLPSGTTALSQRTPAATSSASNTGINEPLVTATRADLRSKNLDNTGDTISPPKSSSADSQQPQFAVGILALGEGTNTVKNQQQAAPAASTRNTDAKEPSMTVTRADMRRKKMNDNATDDTSPIKSSSVDNQKSRLPTGRLTLANLPLSELEQYGYELHEVQLMQPTETSPVGLKLTKQQEPLQYIITAVAKGTKADLAGLKVNDWLIKIEDRDVRNVEFAEVSQEIRQLLTSAGLINMVIARQSSSASTPTVTAARVDESPKQQQQPPPPPASISRQQGGIGGQAPTSLLTTDITRDTPDNSQVRFVPEKPSSPTAPRRQRSPIPAVVPLSVGLTNPPPSSESPSSPRSQSRSPSQSPTRDYIGKKPQRESEGSATEPPVRHVTLKEALGLDFNSFIPEGDSQVQTHFISNVQPSSMADMAGLRDGDRILSVNGFDVTHSVHEDVRRMMQSKKPLQLSVVNDPKYLELIENVKRGKDKGPSRSAATGSPPPDYESLPRSGETRNATIRTRPPLTNVPSDSDIDTRASDVDSPKGTIVLFTDDKGDFSVKHCILRKDPSYNGYGIVLRYQNGLHLIDQVEPQSPAYNCGLRENDIILFINKSNAEQMTHDDVKILIRKLSMSNTDIDLILANKHDIPRYKIYEENHPMNWSNVVNTETTKTIPKKSQTEQQAPSGTRSSADESATARQAPIVTSVKQQAPVPPSTTSSTASLTTRSPLPAGARLCTLIPSPNHTAGFALSGKTPPPFHICQIEQNSPAEKGGLILNDILLSINGKSVADKNYDETVKIIREALQQSTIELIVKSPTTQNETGQSSSMSDQTKSLSIGSGESNTMEPTGSGPPGELRGSDPSSSRGANAVEEYKKQRNKELSYTLRLCHLHATNGDGNQPVTFGFELSEEPGLEYPLIARVEHQSPAEGAGLQSRDILLKINERKTKGLGYDKAKKEIEKAKRDGRLEMLVVDQEAYDYCKRTKKALKEPDIKIKHIFPKSRSSASFPKLPSSTSANVPLAATRDNLEQSKTNESLPQLSTRLSVAKEIESEDDDIEKESEKEEEEKPTRSEQRSASATVVVAPPPPPPPSSSSSAIAPTKRASRTTVNFELAPAEIIPTPALAPPAATASAASSSHPSPLRFTENPRSAPDQSRDARQTPSSTLQSIQPAQQATGGSSSSTTKGGARSKNLPHVLNNFFYKIGHPKSSKRS